LPKESVARCFELTEASHVYSVGHQKLIAKYIRPNNYALDVVKEISHHHDQIIISNSSIEALTRFIKIVGLEKFFPTEKAFGANAHLKDIKTKKHHVLRAYLRDKKFEYIIFIGDSTEDVELVSIAGGKTYLYAHPNKAFREVKVDFRIKDLREVLREL